MIKTVHSRLNPYPYAIVIGVISIVIAMLIYSVLSYTSLQDIPDDELMAIMVILSIFIVTLGLIANSIKSISVDQQGLTVRKYFPMFRSRLVRFQDIEEVELRFPFEKTEKQVVHTNKKFSTRNALSLNSFEEAVVILKFGRGKIGFNNYIYTNFPELVENIEKEIPDKFVDWR